MEIEQFNELVDERFGKCRETLCTKSEEYARNNDKLHNFKRAGDIGGTSPEKALVGMMVKHVVSLLDIVDDIEYIGTTPTDAVLSEKVGDTINYLLLLEALIRERMVKDAK
jgi:hypothetical protein